MISTKRILLVAVLLLGVLLSGCSNKDGTSNLYYLPEIEGYPIYIAVIDGGRNNGVSLNDEENTIMCSDGVIDLRVDFTSFTKLGTLDGQEEQVINAKVACLLGQLWFDQILEPLIAAPPAP